MSEMRTSVAALHRSLRIVLLVSGLITAAAGVVILIWPAKSAMFATALIGSYLVVAGLIYLALSVFSRPKGWVRAGHAFLGLLYIAAGMLTYFYLPETTITLTWIAVLVLGISWIVDGLVALSFLASDLARPWTWVYALIAVAAGAAILLFPVSAVEALWLLIGSALIAFGLVQLIRALLLGRGEPEVFVLATGQVIAATDGGR